MINILMPLYNGIEFIDESVTSIKKQTFKEWELIIGINGHPPNSDVYKKAKEHENDKIKVIDLFEIKGKSNALNSMLSSLDPNIPVVYRNPNTAGIMHNKFIIIDANSTTNSWVMGGSCNWTNPTNLFNDYNNIIFIQ